ncbi:MAG: hypothetical protein KatS3mg010_0769 [Acidimicrobiia bacterium]|nr:MAG: hypothetical protein KatS3mg010_0769 [Acidimicrobiia bacterium]
MSEVAPGGPPRHDVPVDGHSAFTLVDGRQVHYLWWGRCSAPPVVCLHGGGQTAYMYEELGAALRDRWFVVAPDLPGHGDSDVDLAVAGTVSGLGPARARDERRGIPRPRRHRRRRVRRRVARRDHEPHDRGPRAPRGCARSR